MPKKSTTSEFIKKAKETHKDKYDYSNVSYVKSNQKVEILCKVHGLFLQKPMEHLANGGCRECGRELANKKRKSTTKDFIMNAEKIHENKYDYSNVDYVHNKTKVEIICKIHGIFLQSPHDHLQGNNCYKCHGTPKATINDFIEKSKKVHGNKYDYSIVEYSGNKIKVGIICHKHGMFLQQPLIHTQGHGCPNCSGNISKKETEFLNHMNVQIRNYRLPEWTSKPVDGYDKATNTIYEFLGDYWHGNLNKYKLNSVNKKNKKTFGQLYNDTFIMLNKIKSFGYNVKYIWESDWEHFVKNDKTSTLTLNSV